MIKGIKKKILSQKNYLCVNLKDDKGHNSISFFFSYFP